MARVREASRTLLYLLAVVPMGVAGAAVLLAGWILSICVAITPLAVPVLIGFRATVGGVAHADAWLARTLVGASVLPRRREDGRSGYWRRAADVLSDEGFWKQQSFLLLAFLLGGAFAIVEFSLLAAGLGAIAQPVSYRWTSPSFGSWHVDTFGRALLFVPVGIIAVVLALSLLGPIAAGSRRLADGLLGGGGGGVTPTPGPSRSPRGRWEGLAIAGVTVAGIGLLQVVVWAATARGYFWPAWTIYTLGVPVLFYAWIVVCLEQPHVLRLVGNRRGLAIHAGGSFALAVYFTLAWSLGSHAYFWPVWPILVLFAALAAHVVGEAIRSIRGGRLAERITVLETTRAGAVDQQETQLRRIERDLHDGAQARLVALGMSLGMAEQKLASDPAAARELLADARRGAQEALAELRDLARGIHPPVLADRGLEAAIAALTNRTPLHVRVSVDIDERPPAPVESAAYFVVSEALANTGKHANAEHVDIAVRRRRDTLIVEVADDGDGNANPSGAGLSGLARRVEALDGTLEISSPPGGPTTLRAVMPCGS